MQRQKIEVMVKRLAELEDRKNLNRGFSKPFDSHRFQTFFQRITDLWEKGKLTAGRFGIVPTEVLENEIIFELRGQKETVQFSTLMFPQAAAASHRQLWKRFYKKENATPPPERFQEVEYVPTPEELKAARQKLAKTPAWILDRYEYRRGRFLLEFENAERQKRNKLDFPEMK